MLTMQKEKVNTHFSFPMKLDMSGYVEKTLLPQQYQESITELNEQKKWTEEINAADDLAVDDELNEQYEYNLIGVTVHTGNADGGHYYSFIKERNGPHPHAPDRWFLFNDAEVKQFDPSQIEAECFGGEMTSKTYDTVTEKYLDFSFEKTNSAYMLFYERVQSHQWQNEAYSEHSFDEAVRSDDLYEQASCSTNTATPATATKIPTTVNKISDFNRVNETFDNSVINSSAEKTNEPLITDTPTDSNEKLAVEHNKCDIDTKSGSDCNETLDKATDACNKSPPLTIGPAKKSPTRHLLSKELEEWIWEDNRYFLQDRNIFEHTYFK